MAFNNEIMVASGGSEADPGQATIENIPGGGGGAADLDSYPYSTADINDNDLVVTKENGISWVRKSFIKIMQYIGIFYGTTAEWEALTTEEKDKYKLIVKTDDNVNAITSAYDIPYGNTSVGNILDKYTPVTLWTGDTGNYAGTASNSFPLSQSYKNFKFLRLYYMIAGNGTSPTRPMVREVSTEQLDYICSVGGMTLSMAWGYVGGATPPDRNYVDIQPSSTALNLVINSNYCKIQKIEGVEQIVHTQISSIDNQVYDSEEREIGTFFGKTLYRRTIYLGNGTDYGLVYDGTARTFSINLGTLYGFTSNYEMVTDDVKVFRADGGRTYFSNNTRFSGDAAYGQGWYDSDTKAFTIQIGRQYTYASYESTLKFVLMIEYTKERIW